MSVLKVVDSGKVVGYINLPNRRCRIAVLRGDKKEKCETMESYLKEDGDGDVELDITRYKRSDFIRIRESLGTVEDCKFIADYRPTIENQINDQCEKLYKRGHQPSILLMTRKAIDTLQEEFNMGTKLSKLSSFAGMFGTLMVHEVEKLDEGKELLVCCS